MTPRSDVEAERGVPPARVARALRLQMGEPNVIVRKRRMYANDVPVQFALSYIPLKIAEGTAIAEPDPGRRPSRAGAKRGGRKWLPWL